MVPRTNYFVPSILGWDSFFYLQKVLVAVLQVEKIFLD
ncbi:hypothetical protein RV01_GL000429 [Enterococcus dispar]|nr:hypothetical protein RV01_GL000429 [Enterococcus dispar]